MAMLAGVDLRISLKKLEILSVVVEEGGVGRAADRLFVSQPVVSAHIRSLEERLGAKLFFRDGRQIHLTEAGQVVNEWATDLLIRTREVERELINLHDGGRGSVIFGASMSVGSYRLPRILAPFRHEHPQVDLRVKISESEHAIEGTRAGVLDFAVILTDADMDVPGMKFQQIGQDELVLVTAPTGQPRGDLISIEALKKLPYVEAPEGTVRRRSVDRHLRRLGVTGRRIVLEIGHPEGLKRAAREGLGVTMLFRSAVEDELSNGDLREIALEGVTLVTPISVVVRKGKALSPLHLNLIDKIQKGLSGTAAGS